MRKRIVETTETKVLYPTFSVAIDRGDFTAMAMSDLKQCRRKPK